MKKQVPILLLLLLFMLPVFGQDSLSNNKLVKENNLSAKKEHIIFEPSTVIKLKDGGIVKCNIISETTNFLTVSLHSQTTILIRKDLIEKIEPLKSRYYYFQNGAAVKKRGLYLSIEQSNILPAIRNATTRDDDFKQISMGIMINNVFAVGIGTGSNIYDAPNKGDLAIPIYTFIPVFVEIRGYHFKKKISPYYAVAIGIGIPDSRHNIRFDRNSTDVHYDQGLFLKPALGLRFATKYKINYFMELGYRIQNTRSHSTKWVRDFIRGYHWRDYDSSISFRRFQYTVGLLF